MPKIRCHYIDCAFLDENYCSAALIELDSDSGCMTFKPNAETPVDDDWDEEALEEEEEWEELEDDSDEEDDLWSDEEEN